MKKIIFVALLSGVLNITGNAQVFKTNGDQSLIGRMLIAPTGVLSDNAYNGNLVITKPTATGQYINLIRLGTYAWSIGTIYNSSTFAIGNSTSNDALFTNPFFAIDPNGGKIGIGTSTPIAKLHINSGANNNYAAILATSNEGNSLVVSSEDTQPAGRTVFKICHEYFNDPNNRNNGYISFHRGNSTDGGFLEFGSNGLERLRIDPYGKIGIGTANPQYMLDVKGAIRATEVLVQSVDQFADFVFEPDYKLLSLTDLSSYLKANRHLPGIPTAKDVKNNGLNLVEMQVKLLQKIEELTLYCIRQEEEIQLLKSDIESMKNR